MNKCFITKLPSSIDNDNLPVLGQLKINWLAQSKLTDNDARAIGLSTNDSITVKVSGAHFTDKALTSNDGNLKTINATDGLVWLYVSNDADAVLTIDNKYSLTRLNFIKPGKEFLGGRRSVYFDIADIKYCTNLTYLDLSWSSVSGDISAVSNLTNLTYLSLVGNNISGDISAISKLTKLNNFNLSNTKVFGDIANLANLSGVLEMSGLKCLPITGDMSKINPNTYTISLSGRPITTNFTWTAGGRQKGKVLTMEGSIPFDTTSMDNMFIDQAKCTFVNINEPWTKIISVRGTRTSASDDAVTAIQNMGITITGVTKQA